MLEENTVILLVNTDSVLDSSDRTVASGEFGVEVVDHTLAVAAQSERVGHVSCAVFTKIKSVLSLMRMFGVSAVEVRDLYFIGNRGRSKLTRGPPFQQGIDGRR